MNRAARFCFGLSAALLSWWVWDGLYAQAAGAHHGRALADLRDAFEASNGLRPVEQRALIGRIEIAEVGISAVILEGIDSATLHQAVGHIPGTPFPGESGNSGLAAHRDTLFRGLQDIQAADSIVVTTPDATYRYIVEETRIVEPEDISVLTATETPSLTLVTCYPFDYIGPAPQRFIVRARRVHESPPATQALAAPSAR